MGLGRVTSFTYLLEPASNQPTSWLIPFWSTLGARTSHKIFLNIHYYLSQYFLIWKKYFFEFFSIFENNIINVKLAKVRG
jgi:hypothetical protein